MPTYAYACTECDHRFEVVQSFDDDALTVCPACEGRLRKVFNAVGIVFKGGGFYQTDYRSESYKKAESADKNGSTSSDASAPKSSEAAPKPADKPAEASPASRSEKKKPRE